MTRKIMVTSIVVLAFLVLFSAYEITKFYIDNNENVSEDIYNTSDVNNANAFIDEAIDDLNYETVEVDANEMAKVTLSTRIVYQEYYINDGKIDESESEPPYYLIGLTREEVEAYYTDWELIAFSSNKIVLRKNIEQMHTAGYYIIKEYKEQICVYYYYINDFAEAFEEVLDSGEYSINDEEVFFIEFMEQHEDEYLREVIDMPISLLSSEERAKLKEGIIVYGEEELLRILENYTS